MYSTYNQARKAFHKALLRQTTARVQAARMVC